MRMAFLRIQRLSAVKSLAVFAPGKPSSTLKVNVYLTRAALLGKEETEAGRARPLINSLHLGVALMEPVGVTDLVGVTEEVGLWVGVLVGVMEPVTDTVGVREGDRDFVGADVGPRQLRSLRA